VIQLFTRPLPLVDADRKIVVLWSPKSACTTAYVWFSALCGFLPEVRAFGDWPHAHREQVFRKLERYRAARTGDISDYHVVKIIRDPYARAASCFRHAVRNRLVEQRSISFRDFLLILARNDMEAVNIHFWPQFHLLERVRRPDTIINVSKGALFAELNALEARMGWPVTDFASMAWLRELENARRPIRLATDKSDWFAEPILRSRPPKSTPFPQDSAFLTPEAKLLIARIYRADFEAYSDWL